MDTAKQTALGAPVTGTKKEQQGLKGLRRGVRALVWLFCGLLLLWGGLQLWMATAEKDLRWYPEYPRLNLAALVQKDKLSKGDYRTLLLQTGLGAPGVDTLREQGGPEDFERLQKYFFAQPRILCDKNTPVSAEERVADTAGNKTPGTMLVGLEAGDIFITSSCHTFGWRNGHAALVVDAENGVALESVVLGQDSCLQRVEKWACFPTFMVLRLRGASKELRGQIAAEAVKNLNGVPYGLAVGLFSEKYGENGTAGTHCAHLVWSAFRRFGYDLDSTGGAIVTPRDIANSPLLQVCQVYGFDPDRLWE